MSTPNNEVYLETKAQRFEEARLAQEYDECEAIINEFRHFGFESVADTLNPLLNASEFNSQCV